MARIDGDRESFAQIGSYLPGGKRTELPEKAVTTWTCAGCGKAVEVTALGLQALADANRLLAKTRQAPIDPHPPCQDCRAALQRAESDRFAATQRTAHAARQRLLAGPRPELAERSDWQAVRQAFGEAEVRRVDEQRRKGHRSGDGV